MRILLVEDEPDLGEAIKRILTQKAYIVDWVQDGTEAWNYLENRWTEYTLAIFDWLLPGLSGIQLCQKLRHQGSLILGVEGGFTAPNSHSKPCLRLSSHTAPSLVDCYHQNIRFLLSHKTHLLPF